MIAGVRPDERPLAVPAALALVALGGAAALVASAGDALVLSRIGPRHLGTLFAVSSAALVVVLAWVGAVADRRDRGRVVLLACALAALLAAALAALLPVAPRLTAAATLIGGKQVAAAIDLGFWVLVAERLDARQARRLVPVLVAANGAGLVGGGLAVAPLADLGGLPGVLYAAAALFVLGAAAARGFARRGGARPVTRPLVGRGGAGALLLGWRAVRRSAMARNLAMLIAVAGVFAPILYYLVGVAAAAHYGAERELASFLGRFRGGVQALTLLAQLALAPALMARAGVARALLVAPAVALAAAAGLLTAGVFWVVAAAQGATRLVDAAVQTPAEKLAQNLLPPAVRGRVAGFLDGVAKRVGAIAGGLTASALVVWPRALAALTGAVALAWLLLAWRLRRRFPALAVAELAAPGNARAADADEASALGDPRSVEHLRVELLGGPRQALAIGLLEQLGERGRVDVAAELATAARRAPADAAPLLVALERYLERHPEVGAEAGAATEAVVALVEEGAGEARLLALRCLVLLARPALAAGERDPRATLARLAMEPGPPVRLLASLALARLDGDADRFDALLEGGCEALDAEARRGAVRLLCADLVGAARAEPLAAERLLDRLRMTLRAVRYAGADIDASAALLALAEGVRRAGQAALVSPELVLVRGDARALAEDLLDPDRGEPEQRSDEPSVRAAALHLLDALGDAGDGPALARALGDPHEPVRRAAAEVLGQRGAAVLEPLLLQAAYGRRQARDAALGLLSNLRVSDAALVEVIDRELRELETTCARLMPLSRLSDGALVVKRLEERIGEAAHTLFLSLEARLGAPPIGAAARRLLRARDPLARARALEALDAVLPRPIANRVLPVLEAAPLDERSVAACAALGRRPYAVDEAVRDELAGGDRLARALVIHALGRSGRAAHRAAINAAAQGAARAFDPLELLRRLEHPTREDDMPRSMETLLALARVPIFAELTTRQLAELAEVVRWHGVDSGETVVAQGELADAMYFVASGSVRVEVAAGGAPSRTVTVLGAGEPFGEMALFESDVRSATVVAAERTRLGRIERADFEDLVDDVPGIALAICRVLSRRVRHMNDAPTRAPVTPP